MATSFSMSAEVPKADIDAFVAACNRYRDELGNTQKVAMRRGTIALVRSLRARTAKAKKQAPLSHVTRYSGPGPHYLTPKKEDGGETQHRFAVRRRVGSNREKTYVVPADSRAAARKRSGQYTKWGLAKKSWGWFMHALFNRANPENANPKAKLPRGAVEGYIKEGANGVEVFLCNRLGYIRDAMPGNALEEAMRAATKSINKQIDAGLAKARKELE